MCLAGNSREILNNFILFSTNLIAIGLKIKVPDPLSKTPATAISLASLPADLPFDRNQNELVMEMVFKLFLNAYYKCSEFFQAHPIDMGRLYMEFENAVNENGLLFRW